MMKHFVKSLQVGFVLVASTLLLSAIVLAAGEQMPRSVISGGGGRITGGNVVLHGTLGQPVVGSVANDSYRLCSGFWCGGGVYKIYLPLTLRNFPIVHHGDAPDTCANSRPTGFYPPNLYRDNFGHAQDRDWYTFNANAGTTYTIYTSDLSSRADTVLFLFTTGCPVVSVSNVSCVNNVCKIGSDSIPNSECQCNDDAGPTSSASSISWSASSNSTPKIFVRNYDWDRTYGIHTDYTLRVETAP